MAAESDCMTGADDNVALYRERASQLRRLAARFQSQEARLQLTLLAAMYETLAQRQLGRTLH
jgi:hypothetical protein